MNSAPHSIGSGHAGSCRVSTRPPSRPRPSRRITFFPSAESTSAAANPATPPPITITSAYLSAMLHPLKWPSSTLSHRAQGLSPFLDTAATAEPLGTHVSAPAEPPERPENARFLLIYRGNQTDVY